MKKSFLFLATAGLVLASCSNNDLKNDIEEIEVPISFEQSLEKVTKAEIANERDLGVAGGFAVFGYKYNTDLTWANDWSTTNGSVIFNNVNVTTSAAKTDDANKNDYAWSYTPTKYWDKNSTYNFFAIAPYQAAASAKYSISSSGMFTITDVAYGDASADATVDYVIDRDGEKNVSGSYTTGTSHPVVPFDFHHIMAKIDFKLKRADGITAELKVKKVTMKGWSKDNGTFVQTKTETPTTIENSEWTVKPADKAGSEVIMENADGTVVTTADVYGTKTFIMVPQDIATETLEFEIDYTLGGEPFTKQIGKVKTAQTWGTDSHITYTVTIGPEAIVFDVNSVCDFCAPSDPNPAEGGATIQ